MRSISGTFEQSALTGARVSAGGGDPLHDRLGGGVIVVINHRDPRTLGAVTNRDGFADALRPAGDDRHFAFQLHRTLLHRENRGAPVPL